MLCMFVHLQKLQVVMLMSLIWYCHNVFPSATDTAKVRRHTLSLLQPESLETLLSYPTTLSSGAFKFDIIIAY